MNSASYSCEGRGPFPLNSAEELSRDEPPSQPGKGCFSSATQKLSGTLPVVLGWTADQFWDSTPAELTAIFAVLADNAPSHFSDAPLDTRQIEKLKEMFPDG